MAGRKPNLGSVVRLRGKASHRPTKEPEVGLGGDVGYAPKHLPEPVKEKWREMRQAWGLVLTTADRDLLERYCVQWVRYREAQRQIAEHGVLIAAPNGFPCQSPWVKESDLAEAHLRRISQQIESRLRPYIGAGGDRGNRGPSPWDALEA